MSEGGTSRVSNLLNKVFSSCDDDPKGSVHRAWGLSLIFVAIYFVLSIIEMINLNTYGGSKALVASSVWTGLVHLLLAILGTFVLKRFPTSFSVGFLLGVLIVLANQNLILFGTFHNYSYGTLRTNNAFSNLAFSLFLVLAFFAIILFHFKRHVVVAPIDAKGLGRNNNNNNNNNTDTEAPTGGDYQQYEED